MRNTHPLRFPPGMPLGQHLSNDDGDTADVHNLEGVSAQEQEQLWTDLAVWGSNGNHSIPATPRPAASDAAWHLPSLFWGMLIMGLVWSLVEIIQRL